MFSYGSAFELLIC